MLFQKRFTLFFAFILLLVTPLTYGVERLVDPDPISIPAGLTEEKLVKLIISAAKARGWTATQKEPGKIEANIIVRGKHYVSVAIVYDANLIKLSYLNSQNMRYKMATVRSDPNDEWSEEISVPMIHQKYNSWVINLANDIQQTLNDATN